jgi:hypothetical protein
MQKREGKSVIETCNLCWAFKVWWESMPVHHNGTTDEQEGVFQQ